MFSLRRIRNASRPVALRYLLITFSLLLAYPAAHSSPFSAAVEPIRIAAAADLQPVLPPLLEAYRRQTGHTVEASFASSATLATQIENGAPFDIFLSADMALPEKIVRDGFAAQGATATPYARGTLVLWTRNGKAISSLNMQSLETVQVHSIAIANAEHAPYGRAAMQALHSLGLEQSVRTKLRVAENIAQAAQFASTGNADVGLISLTLAQTLATQGRFIVVPHSAYTPILQGAVALRHAGTAQHANDFLRFLHSSEVVKEMKQRGLEPVH